MEAAVMRTQRAMAIKSVPLNGRAEYQVRFRFFPKPLSSMAFAMRSILSMLEMISGNSIMTAFYSLLIRDCLRLAISSPLACCALDMSWYSLWMSGMYLSARETE